MAIEFTEDMVTAFNNSFKDKVIMTFATASAEGMPDIALKGSGMAWDNEHIAFWERALGQTYRNLQENPKCCVFYRNPETRQVWKMFGEATVYTEGDLRQQVMDRTEPVELSRDPDRKGAAIIIRIDRVLQGGQVLMER